MTEEEIQQGILLTSSLSNSALCYVRELEGITNVPFNNATVTRYLDILEQRHLDETAQELLSELVTQKLPTKLTPDQFKTYTTKWTGTPLEMLEEQVHKAYLDRFCSDFVKDIQTMVSERRARPGKDVPTLDRDVYLEVLQHSKFCLKKCEVFCGQEDTIQKVKRYIEDLHEPHQPLVIHGRSGYGKTSLLAHIGKFASKELSDVDSVVIRFLGTSPGSSSIKCSLLSITKQLGVVYDLDTTGISSLERMSDVRREFVQCVQMVSHLLREEKKLLIILDSIDQLSPAFGSHQMYWLPRMLPKNVGMILSMLTDRYACYNAAKERLRDPEAFIELREMPTTTGKQIVQQYLQNYNRQITPYQTELIMKAFATCQQPLFLKLLLDDARQWKSYTKPSGLELLTSIQAAINQLFETLEEKFGRVFVRGALGYLTCGKDGLTGVELEDVLSCDDEVLNEVYAFHDPPLSDVIRLPPLLWARLQYEIQEYLVERTADGKTVMAWYHRLFWETATQRFVEPSPRKRDLHRRLAEVFSCEHSVKKSVVLQKRNNLTMVDADRQVAPQPLTVKNVRKLNSLPFHLFHSCQFEELKNRCLLDFDWLLTKIRAMSVMEITDEYDFFCSGEPLSGDSAVCLIKDFLHLAFEPLKEDPQQLAYQVLERLAPLCDRYPSLATFVEKAKHWTDNTRTPLLLPVHNTSMKSPESALIFSFLAGNTGVISKTGEVAVCGFLDKLSGKFKVQIWNLISRDITESVPSKATHLFVISGDSHVMAIVKENTVSVYDTRSGDLLLEFRYRQDKCLKCYIKSVCLDEKGHMLVIGSKIGEKAKGSGIRYRSEIHLIDLQKAEVTEAVEYSCPGSRSLEQLMLVPGEEKLLVLDYEKIVVYDIKKLSICRTFDELVEIKVDTFCFSESGNVLFGTSGGYNSESSRILAINLESGTVETSDILFAPTPLSRKDDRCSRADDELDPCESDSGSDGELVLTRAFSLLSNPQGSVLLAGLSSVGADRQNAIAVWHRDDGDVQTLELPERKERFPKCMEAFPDWTSAVVGWDDGLMMFIDLPRMMVTKEMKAHEMSLNVMRMIPEKGHLVSIGTDRNLKVWDIDHLQREMEDLRTKPRRSTTQVCLDEHEQVVDFSSVDSMVVTALPYPTSPPKLWSTTTAQPCTAINASLQQSYQELYPEKSELRKDVNLTFLQDGRYLVDVRRRRAEAKAHVIDINSLKIVSKFETFNPHLIIDDRYFLTVTFGELRVRELPSGEVIRTVKMSPWPEGLVKEHVNTPPQIAVTGNKKYFVFINLTGNEKYVEVVDLKSYSVLCKSDIPENLAVDSFLSFGYTYLLVGKSNSVSIRSPESLVSTDAAADDICFKEALISKMISPSLRYGITLQSSPNTLTLWDTDSGSSLYKTNALPQKIHCVCFSPNEQYFLTGSYNVVSIWSVQTGETLSRIHTYGAVCRLSFTPSGKHALIHCYAAPKRKRLIICKALNMRLSSF